MVASHTEGDRITAVAELHRFILCVTYILSLGIIFFYIMCNPVIVIWTNYFVFSNDFHITENFIL